MDDWLQVQTYTDHTLTPLMSDNDEVKLYYEGDFIDEDENVTREAIGFSIVSKKAYISFWHETEHEPCRCNVQGCMSCFIEETVGYAKGFGDNISMLWFDTKQDWNYP